MSIVLTNTAISLVPSPAATPFKLIMAPVVFTKQQDLVLETPGLNADSHITTQIAKTIWVH